MSRIRITMGAWKGRYIRTSSAASYRPVPSRLREALFNRIGTKLPMRSFLDGYAGTGSMGIYALSLGCGHAGFIEQDPRSVKKIRETLSDLGASERATVWQEDILVVTRTAPQQPYEWVFLGPPFALPKSSILRVLRNLSRNHWLNGESIVIIQRHAKTSIHTAPGWEPASPPLQHGENILTFLRPSDS